MTDDTPLSYVLSKLATELEAFRTNARTLEVYLSKSFIRSYFSVKVEMKDAERKE